MEPTTQVLPPATTDAPALAATRRKRFDQNFASAVTAVFLALCGGLMLRHGMWRDEAQAFLLARDSASLAELFQHLRYEGHPGLWHVLLYALTRVTVYPQTMQVLHLLMAATSVWLVARYAPFSRLERALFAFGYYPLFEYGVISRNYQIALLLAVAFCVLWQARRTAFVWQGLLLGLLANTNVFGLILAGALGAMILVDVAVSREARAGVRQKPWRFIAGLGLAAALACWSVAWMIPPPDNGYAPGWNYHTDSHELAHTFSALWSGYVPIPVNQRYFWTSNILRDGNLVNHYAEWATIWGLAIAAALLLTVCWRLRSLVVFVIATAGMLAFLHIKYFGTVRHHGNLFVVVVVCVWLAWADRVPAAGPRAWWKKMPIALGHAVFVSLLTVQVWAAAVAVNQAARYPFSLGHAAARFVEKELKPGELLVAEPDSAAASVAVYLPGRQFYYPQRGEWGTFSIWDTKRFATGGAMAAAQKMAKERGTSVILILTTPAGALPPGVSMLHSFTGGLVADENYYVYRIEAPQTAPASAP